MVELVEMVELAQLVEFVVFVESVELVEMVKIHTNVGILVSRIPDISGRRSRHFQIVGANPCIFGIRKLQCCPFMTQFNSK